jgi:hypothetical protein
VVFENDAYAIKSLLNIYYNFAAFIIVFFPASHHVLWSTPVYKAALPFVKGSYPLREKSLGLMFCKKILNAEILVMLRSLKASKTSFSTPFM